MCFHFPVPKVSMTVVESVEPQSIKWLTPQENSDEPQENHKKVQRIEKKLLHCMGKAIHDFELIKPHDKILVCVSGGKDSITLLLLLKKLQARSNVPFDFLCFTLDQSQPGWDDTRFRAFLEFHQMPYDIVRKDTYSVVKEKIGDSGTYCGLCSRLRRGNIYHYARTHGFNKVALGHHRDDLIESLMMGIFYNGEVRSMPPKLLTDDKSLTVIRPLVYVQEKDIKAYSELKQFPIIPCNLCGSQTNLARNKMKKLLAELAKENPKIPSNMLSAIQNIRSTQLMDRSLCDFNQLEDNQVINQN